MEVKVEVHGENPVTGESCHTTTAYLVFVALEGGSPIPVPEVEPETEDEQALHERALQRRLERLALRRED